MSEERVQPLDIVGRSVDRAYTTKDANGYDFVHITFTDGSALMVAEEGQCGYLSVKIADAMLKARDAK